MKLCAGKSALQPKFFLIFLLLPISCAAQQATAQQGTVLAGTVTDATGKPVANAHVSAHAAQSGPTVQATTDANGKYTLPALTPGSCTITVSAEGFETKDSQVNCAGTGLQTLDLTLTASTPQQLPNAPSLQDLGFSQQQMQGNPQLQARLNKRTEMLKIHQTLGFITLAPMAAALITGPMAKAKGRNGQTITEPTNANLDFHAALGSTTAALYFTTAYFAMFAPKIPGVQKRGAIRWHEALAFVHGPGMILTPILGAMAFQQEQNGEKVHGIASAHGTVAIATVIAYGASIVAVSWPIHLKFWEK